ncbi:hypothetical protein [Paractinoplanes rishiriensis]|uniref:Uncharacterized protein n=1 Tax=Paractinoplanes rishiriensis TaxID=1050105 RepID=A0A919JUY9_9ACTN|nr:hypothetical protein [Actinoplanes rishiriensis]GIE95295.1 hypothetical protein Ari01nite_27600 [Actinoplanes rishiriensis]
MSFSWWIDDGPATDAAADSTGKASMTYTPPANFETHTLHVTGRKADGTTTDTTTYSIYVAGGA